MKKGLEIVQFRFGFEHKLQQLAADFGIFLKTSDDQRFDIFEIFLIQQCLQIAVIRHLFHALHR